MKSRLCVVLFLTALLGAQRVADCDPSANVPYVAQAETLVQDLQHATLNVYGGGHREIQWGPDDYRARTVCSSFISLLFEHTYHWTDADIKQWLGMTDPQANDYHDAIVRQDGFTQIHKIADVQRGDIIAIRYNDGSADTGHVMLVDQVPQPHSATAPLVPQTTQYDVTVIDSSASGHGPKDTRFRGEGQFTGGIGRGIFRLYVAPDGVIVGYAWSDSAKSVYYTRPARALVVGRPHLH